MAVEWVNEVNMRVYPAFFPLTLLHGAHQKYCINGKGLLPTAEAEVQQEVELMLKALLDCKS